QSLSTLSVGGSLFFTPRQLYYFINRRLNAKRPDPLKAGGCALLIGGAALTVYLFFSYGGLSFLLLLPLLGVAFGIALLFSRGLRHRLRDHEHGQLLTTPGQVEGWYGHWRKLNDEAVKMLPPPASTPGRKPQAAQINPEVLKYSFDRVVVCDRPEIAQCLIANNFHFEHNCAVLSLDGYPHDIFETVMQMLRRNPDLSVYALHDASPAGVELSHILRTDPRWFADSGANVYDLGLLPRQIFKRQVFVERGGPRAGGAATVVPPHVAATLEPEEVRWLEEGNYVSLESFTPQTLLRVVALGIAKSRDPRAADALVPVTVGDGGGAGIFIYTTDSFG
ncbi:MAG: hypothetical protein ABW208_13640, partial [Pyrinomonadaceae bacterium]